MLLAAGSGSPEYFTENCLGLADGMPFPITILVHTPVHASWLNQVEILFSIVQRKVLSPNDFDDLDVVVERLAAFRNP